ncbi:hypothetical protein [Streptomyces sp. CBMA29]|uniref:hypothetical protein n=1 Tax=Streptomyces sp. CBMA29 TaxID=1896314 RepID=UPI0016618E71|nr:hypothetical protein [Streptomyces sp. CBMA29]MBD0740075.1 hypothetical protein [Streptomyces sp. CBMA29]
MAALAGAPPHASAAAKSPAAAASTDRQTFLTFYGWYDNTPPGGDISCPGPHETAGDTGTGRYVRVNGTAYGTARGTAYGYSLHEVQVYGTTP